MERWLGQNFEAQLRLYTQATPLSLSQPLSIPSRVSPGISLTTGGMVKQRNRILYGCEQYYKQSCHLFNISRVCSQLIKRERENERVIQYFHPIYQYQISSPEMERIVNSTRMGVQEQIQVQEDAIGKSSLPLRVSEDAPSLSVDP